MLLYFGVLEDDVNFVLEVFVFSDLWGIDLYGVVWLYIYFDMFELKWINLCFEVWIVRELFSMVIIDGDNGFGLVVGFKVN